MFIFTNTSNNCELTVKQLNNSEHNNEKTIKEKQRASWVVLKKGLKNG